MRWQIRSADGAKVASIESKELGHNFVVAEDRVVAEFGLMIFVYDVDSGELVYRRPVRPTHYAGPVPP